MTSADGLGGAADVAVSMTTDPQGSLDDTLVAIATTAAAAVPGFDHAAISVMHTPTAWSVVAANSPTARTLDELQHALLEGPAAEVARTGQLVAAPRLHSERRWPRYARDAATEGVCAQLSTLVNVERSPVRGTLSLYSTTRDEIPPNTEPLARLLAAQAAIAMWSLQTIEGLESALASRTVIGEALGIVMARFDVSEDQAMQYLKRASSHGNVKLRMVAQQLVDEQNRAAASDQLGR